MLPPLTVVGTLRYAVVRRLLDGLEDVRSVLEIGTGVGAVGARLARDYDYVGVEQDARSAGIASERIGRYHGTVVTGTTRDLPPTLVFDLVCAFEVVEHIEDDEGALRDWRRLVRPGGRLLLSVPAWRRRFGAYDELAGHLRRYDRDDLESLAARAGYVDVQTLAYGYPLGNALQAAWDVLARLSPPSGSPAEQTARSGRWLQPHPLLGWLTRAVAAPFDALQRPLASADLGIGLILLARRPLAGDDPAASA